MGGQMKMLSSSLKESSVKKQVKRYKGVWGLIIF